MKAFRLTACLVVAMLLLSSCGIIIINRGDGTEAGTESETGFAPPPHIYESQDYPLATETDGEAVSRNRLKALPDKDMGGKTVFFAVAQEAGYAFNEEDSLYRAMVLKRNGMVNEKYNTQIITECLTAETLYDTVMKAEKSGDFFSDFLVLRSGDMNPYLLAGYLLNLKSLPFTDYSAPYFNQEAMSQLTLGGAVYGAVGDATEQLEHYVCLYFNKTYAKELGVSCPYEDVYEGTFTWERFLTSLSGLPEGAVGFVSAFSDSNTAAMSFFSGGGNFLVANQKGKLRLACENDVATALVGHVKSLLKLDTPSLTWTPAGKDETEKLEGFDIFEKGQALYAMGTLDKMELLENAGFSWEVLPLPKVSTDAPYSTPLTGNAPIIVALASSQNVDTMGYILQAVNAASCGYVINEFYTDAMRRLITGVNTLDMLDIIRENPLYDIGFMLGEDAKAVREGTYGAFYEAVKGKNAFSSYLDKKESALNKYLDKLL